MMPIVPSARTHSSAKRNFAPALTEKTSSPISTKPPIAVSMPRKSSRGFFIALLAEPFFERLEFLEERVELAFECFGLSLVAVGLRERSVVVVEPPRERGRAHRGADNFGRDARRLQFLAPGVD